MADIVTDAQIAAQDVGLAMRFEIVLVEPNDVVLALQDAAGFGFQAKGLSV